MHSASDPAAAAVAGVTGIFFLVWLGAIVIGLILTVFWIIELIDVARREFPDPNTKILWVLLVVLAHGIGALIYYLVGKRQGTLPGEQPRINDHPGIWPPPPR